MAIGNARSTLGSMFGMVGTVANTATSLVNVIGDGVQYVDNYTKSILSEQEVRLAVDAVDFEDRVATEKAVEMTERATAIGEFLAKNPNNAAHFDASMSAIRAALEARKAPAAK